MTEEQIKQKAEAEADKVIIGSGMDRASVIHLKHLLTTFYIQGYHARAIEAREIMQKLITNAPDTYSGTNIELQQKKMFSFQDAINKAEQFLKETE